MHLPKLTRGCSVHKLGSKWWDKHLFHWACNIPMCIRKSRENVDWIKSGILAAQLHALDFGILMLPSALSSSPSLALLYFMPLPCHILWCDPFCFDDSVRNDVNAILNKPGTSNELYSKAELIQFISSVWNVLSALFLLLLLFIMRAGFCWRFLYEKRYDSNFSHWNLRQVNSDNILFTLQ